MTTTTPKDGLYILRGGKYARIELTDDRERDVLWYLFDNPDHPISKVELLQKVWGVPHPSDNELRYPENYIYSLRQKLGKKLFPHYVDNEGYVFLAERQPITGGHAEALGGIDANQVANLKRIFGHDSELKLVYSELTLGKPVMDAIDAYFTTDEERRKRKEYYLVPTDATYDPGLQFPGTNVACVCEVRGAAYLAHQLGRAGLQTKVLAATSPDVQKDLFQSSFISIGGKPNQMTDQLLRNKNNVFVEIDVTNFPDDPRFKSKDGKYLTPKSDHETDYGLIVRISPEQYPDRTWIACVGLGRPGTSGAAHFLAYNWKFLIERMSSTETDDFACIVKVEAAPNRDDSGTVYQFVQKRISG